MIPLRLLLTATLAAVSVYPLSAQNGNMILPTGDRKAPVRVEPTQSQLNGVKQIEHVIIIMQENWSFDALYGKFPGANGLENAPRSHARQVDPLGNPYRRLKAIDTRTGKPYSELPNNIPNKPFDFTRVVPPDKRSGDCVHNYYQEQLQINGGKMNKFAAWSDSFGTVMSYYDATKLPMAKYARQFVLCDNWFHSCYGGSMLGALWLFSARMPEWPNADPNLVAEVYPSGVVVKDNTVSPEGYVINDAEPYYRPYPAGLPESQRVPPQTHKTIGDRLSSKNVSWKWYAEGWDAALAGNPPKYFEFHHQAPVYFKQFAPGTEARKEHLADLEDFYRELKQGRLPSVSFIRGLDTHSQHPENGTLLAGLDWCERLCDRIKDSYVWPSCVIIVCYDENGGRWDHVSPPVVDEFGPGTRVPAIIISPFAKRRHVDSTSYETTSILKFIEQRWDLKPLASRDAAANNLLNAFDF